MTCSFTLCAAVLVLLVPAIASADVQPAKIFADGMVLQRDTPLNVWGTADPGENISVHLRDAKYDTIANEDGRWLVTMPAQPALVRQEILIVGRNQIKLRNIAFGDVWLASGQSNMEFQVKSVLPLFPEEGRLDTYPDIRQFFVPLQYDFSKPRSDYEKGYWAQANRETVGQFSAVAWFFAKQLSSRYGVTIGIISASVGSTAVESWMSEAALERYPETRALAYRFRDADDLEQAEQANRDKFKNWFLNLDDLDIGMSGPMPWYAVDYNASEWPTLSVPGPWNGQIDKFGNGSVWLRRDIELSPTQAGRRAVLELGNIVDRDQTFINGVAVGSVSNRWERRRYVVPEGLLRPGRNTIVVRVAVNRGNAGMVKGKNYRLLVGKDFINLQGQWKYQVGARTQGIPGRIALHFNPMGLFNAMIAPAANYSIKGVIWYQGEANTRRADSYSDLFATMIADWRQLWGDPDLPFLFVQLTSFMKQQDQPEESNWADLRAAQAEVNRRVHNTYMAVTIDVGEWNDIHPVDKKTVGQRLALGAQSVAYGETEIDPRSPRFRSLCAQSNRLIVTFEDSDKSLEVHGSELKGFAVADVNGAYLWANARIEGDKVVVWNDTIERPLSVRYAWASNPGDANLYDSQGLPAEPFTASLPNQ